MSTNLITMQEIAEYLYRNVIKLEEIISRVGDAEIADELDNVRRDIFLSCLSATRSAYWGMATETEKENYLDSIKGWKGE